MLDFLYYPVSAVMGFWHQAFGLVLGPDSGPAWALSVVFLVLTVRVLLIGPVLSQMRSAHRMRGIAPQLAELRRTHASDPQRLVAETSRLHREHGVSPLRSLLPMLVQLPVFLALFHVLRGFDRAGLSPAQNATLPNYSFSPADVGSFLGARLFGAPMSAYVAMPQTLLDEFAVGRLAVVAVAVPLLLLAAAATHLTVRRSLATQPGLPAWTAWIFPLGVLAGGLFFPFPIAILLYWLTGNAWTLAQQRVLGRLVERREGAIRAKPAAGGAGRGPTPTGA